MDDRLLTGLHVKIAIITISFPQSEIKNSLYVMVKACVYLIQVSLVTQLSLVKPENSQRR